MESLFQNIPTYNLFRHSKFQIEASHDEKLQDAYNEKVNVRVKMFFALLFQAWESLRSAFLTLK